MKVHVVRLLLLLAPLMGTHAISSAQGDKPAVPEEVTFRSGPLELHGFLWKPQAQGPSPAVIWNHGSEAKPDVGTALGPLFTARGYVLLVPHRRGHGSSGNQARWVGDLLAEEEKRNGREARARLVVKLNEEQLDDQISALKYLRSLPFVDNQRIATAGCSFGGIQTLLAAEGGFGLRAAVDFAGAAMNWDGPPAVRDRLMIAARSAQVPIYLIQAQNDYSIEPTKLLSRVMTEASRPHRAKIYPPFGTTNQDGHRFCAYGSAIWADEVFSFLAEHMR